MKRRSVYLLLTLCCFVLCIVIVKLFSNDLFIRGVIGDFIVVIFIYCFVKCISDVKSFLLAISTLALSYLTEFLQYLHLVSYLGLEQSELAKIIIGATFDFTDLVAYTAGVICVYLLDTTILKRIAKEY